MPQGEAGEENQRNEKWKEKWVDESGRDIGQMSVGLVKTKLWKSM
jgi:hypothetical protein